MGLPPVAGMYVVTRADGTQAYSRYSQEELDARNQAYAQQKIPIAKDAVPGNYNPEKPYYTFDDYAAERQAAIKSGSFDYGAVKSSEYSPPKTFVNKAGQTVTRVPSQPTQTQSQAEHDRQKQMAQERLAEDQRQNDALTKLRSLAPGSIVSGSPEDIRVREIAAQAEKKDYISGGFQQTTSSPQIKPQQKNISLQENLNIEATDPEQLNHVPTFSKGTNEFRATTAQTLSQLQQAKEAGITKLDIYDAKGNKIGSTNPQDIVRARYDILKAASTSGGPVTARGTSTTTKTTQTTTQGITTTQTEQNYREDPLSLLARPILEFGASVGAQLIETFKTGKFATPPIVSLLKGEQPSLTTPEVSAKLESTFGVSKEVEQAKSGKLTPIQETAALAGIVSSVAIPIVAGAGGIGKVPELSGLSAKLSGKGVSQVTKKVIPSIKEGQLEVQQEKIGKTTELSQGTEQKITITEMKIEKAPVIVERLPSGKVQAVQPELPKGITLTKPVETIGQTGTKTVTYQPSDEEIAKRYPLFGKGNNDLSDLTKGETYVAPKATENKPVFGKVTQEVPNIIKTNPEKSGPAEIPFAYVSEKQIAYVRSPSELPENKIIISGKPTPELKSTFGLVKMEGTKNEFISPTLTKGMREYLSKAEEAGLITPRLGETHLQSASDVLKNPSLYAQATREPKLFEQFPEVTRPQVIGQREVYPMKPLEPKKETIPTRKFKKMQPFGPIKESKGGAGQAGKATALLKQSQPLPKRLSPELLSFKTKSESKSVFISQPQARQKEETSIETLAYPKGTESKFLTSFRSAEEILTTSARANKSQTIIKEKIETGQKLRSMEGTKLLQKNIQDTLTISKQNEKTISDVITRTSAKTETGLGTSQVPILNTRQSTTQITKQKTLEVNTPAPKIRETNRKPPIGLLPNDHPLIPTKPKHISKKKLNFLGQASVADIVGLTRRADITYGEKLTAKLTRQDISKAARGTFVVHPISKPKTKETKPFNLYTKLSQNRKTRLSASKTRQPKITRQSKKLKI